MPSDPASRAVALSDVAPHGDAASHDEVALWRKRAESLVDLCEASAWSADLSGVFQKMVDAVAAAFDTDEVHLHLLTPEGDRFVKYASCSGEWYRSQDDGSVSITVGRMSWMMKTRSPIIMDYEHPHSEDEIPQQALDSDYTCAVSVPLLAKGSVLGMVSMVFRERKAWSPDDTDYMLFAGRILGTAIERIQRSRKSLELRILNDRKQLSMEIHDNVSQMISALSLNADTLAVAHEAGNEEAVLKAVDRIARTSREASKLLRSEMLSLCVPLDHPGDLIPGIREYLDLFEKNWGIRTTLTVEGDVESLGAEPGVSLQLFRIMSESLSNVLRHADADNVAVFVSRRNQLLSLVVEDDGCGFDMDAVPPERLGLVIMKERAESVGGQLTIVTGPQGTSVCVDVSMVD